MVSKSYCALIMTITYLVAAMIRQLNYDLCMPNPYPRYLSVLGTPEKMVLYRETDWIQTFACCDL